MTYKKKRLSILILANVFLAFPLLTNSQPLFRICQPVTLDHNQITVGVFPQVELISVLQSISRYPEAFGFLMSGDSSRYKDEVIKHFGPFSTHPAVQMFNRLSLQPRMLNFSAPSNIMLYTDEDLELRNDILPDPFVTDRSGGADSLKVFLGLLRDFAIQTSFNSFFEEHRSFYAAITENTINSVGPTNYISELESFYGRSQRSYNIALVTLYGSVGYGNSLLHPDGQRDIFNTMGPRSVVNGIPVFGDQAYLRHMIRHEFSHPFINPLTEKYWELIKDYANNFDSAPEFARRNVCGDWQECINEFIIRAITTHLAYNDPEDDGSRAYTRESRAVSNLDELLQSIRRYESERDRFPTLESFYPDLLAAFHEID
jgi:hypothetical protein